MNLYTYRLEVDLMKKGNAQVVSIPYGDVFQTLLNDCSESILPVINKPLVSII